MTTKEYTVLLILILSISLAIRLLGIHQPINEDELHWAYSTQTRDWFGTTMLNSPLSIYALNMATALVGTKTWAIRLTFIIAGLATILITTKLAKEQYGQKTALLTAAVLAIHPLHILASLQVAYEGSFLALFFISTLYCTFKYNQTKKKKWIYLTGITFGLSILSKTSAILIIPPIIFIYLLLQSKKILWTLKNTFIVFFVGATVFLFGFALPSIIIKSPALINAVTQLLSQTDAVRTSLAPLMFQYGYALIWLGPIFIFFPIYTSINKKADKLNLIAIIYVALFYLFAIRESTPPIERYWMILLPSLAILSAQGINLILEKKKQIAFWLATIITLVFLFFINLRESRIIPFYPKTAYLENLFSFKWNFLVPITGSSGPLGFYVNAISIIIPFAMTLILFIATIALNNKTKNKNITKIIWIILIGISASYSLFFAQEYLLALTHPNISSITQQTIDYVNQNNLTSPIYYFKNYALVYYFDDKYLKTGKEPKVPAFDYFDSELYNTNYLKELRAITTHQPLNKNFVTLSFGDDTNQKSQQLLGQIKKTGGTIIFIDFPQISKQGPLWKTINYCKKIKTFSDKNKEIAHIFSCAPLPTTQTKTSHY